MTAPMAASNLAAMLAHAHGPAVRAYFRRDGGGWKLVGLDRLPDQAPQGPGPQKANR